MKSVKRTQKNYAVWIGAAFTALIAQGCSFIAPTPQGPGDSRSFRATASANEMPIALPVEIADDIKRIANGERVEGSTAWQQSGGNSNGAQAPEAESETAGATNETSSGSGSGSVVRFRPRRPASKKTGKNEQYVVKAGDTLMKISFEKYGDLYRWREIFEANKDKVRSFSSLPVGTVLSINDVEYVVIEKNGKPYLIRKNDTLAKISDGLYGQKSYWRNLWQNNPTLIRDPNKIYTGFTLYYQDKDQLKDIKISKNDLPRAPRTASAKPTRASKSLPEKIAAPTKAPAPPATAAPSARVPAEAPEPLQTAPSGSQSGWQATDPRASTTK